MSLALVANHVPWFAPPGGLAPAQVVSAACSLLRVNASCQILFSSLVGGAILLPMQKWFPYKLSGAAHRNFVAAHLDWYMLAFMQFGAAMVISNDLASTTTNGKDNALSVYVAAQLLAFGGWVNPTAYVFRGMGINAFELFSRDAKQTAAAALAAVSVAGIFAGWGTIIKLALFE